MSDREHLPKEILHQFGNNDLFYLTLNQAKQSCEERMRVDREIYGETEDAQEDFTP